MEYYRNKEFAAECKFLRYGRKGLFLNSPVIIEFACLCPVIVKGYSQANFSSLDICCLCKEFER